MRGGKPAAEVPRTITPRDVKTILEQFKAGAWGGVAPATAEATPDGQAG